MRKSRAMPKHVQARAAQDRQEERQVRKLAHSHHAPADWKFHAQLIIESWAGKTPNEIAAELHCHPQTVRIHLARFNAQGISGLGMREGAGRKPRLTEQERSRILALVKQPPAFEVRAVCGNPGGPGPAKVRRSGAWMPSPTPPMPQASRWNAVRSGAFTSARARAGAIPIVGAKVLTKTLSQKDRGRHPLHPTASGIDDHLHRRAW